MKPSDDQLTETVERGLVLSGELVDPDTQAYRNYLTAVRLVRDRTPRIATPTTLEPIFFKDITDYEEAVEKVRGTKALRDKNIVPNGLRRFDDQPLRVDGREIKLPPANRLTMMVVHVEHHIGDTSVRFGLHGVGCLPAAPEEIILASCAYVLRLRPFFDCNVRTVLCLANSMRLSFGLPWRVFDEDDLALFKKRALDIDEADLVTRELAKTSSLNLPTVP